MSVKPPPYLSIIVPAYNEARSIVQALTSMRQFLEDRRFSYEVIVVADGTDGTRELARDFARGDPRWMTLGSSQRGGKGRGVRNGVLHALGDVIGFIDADYKTPINEVEKLLPWLRQSVSVVIGSRRAAGAQIARQQPIYRRMGSRAFAAAMRTLVGLGGIRDTQCGFKFFARDAAHRIFSLQRIDGYMFDVEILRIARLLGYEIREVGVSWRDDGDSRYDPAVGTLKNAIDLVRIRRMRYDLNVVPRAHALRLAA